MGRALATLQLADRPDPGVRLDLLLSLGAALDQAGDATAARRVLAEGADLARQLDDPTTLAFCLLALHDTKWSVGSAAERLPIVDEMLDLAHVAGDRELLAQAQLLRATALLELGDPSAPAELQRYCRAADDLGHARGGGERCRGGRSSPSSPVSSTRPAHLGARLLSSARRSASRTRRECATRSCGRSLASETAGRTS